MSKSLVARLDADWERGRGRHGVAWRRTRARQRASGRAWKLLDAEGAARRVLKPSSLWPTAPHAHAHHFMARSIPAQRVGCRAAARAHLTLMARRAPSCASAAVMSNSALSARTDSPGLSPGPIMVCVLPEPVWP